MRVMPLSEQQVVLLPQPFGAMGSEGNAGAPASHLQLPGSAAPHRPGGHYGRHGHWDGCYWWQLAVPGQHDVLDLVAKDWALLQHRI